MSNTENYGDREVFVSDGAGGWTRIGKAQSVRVSVSYLPRWRADRVSTVKPKPTLWQRILRLFGLRA